MNTPLLTKSRANKIYDILVEHAGAHEDERMDFIYHHCESEYGCREWRFIGKLLFGGKYRSTRNVITYYPEHTTEERDALRDLVNKKLKAI